MSEPAADVELRVPASAQKRISATDLADAIAVRYPAPEWYVEREVTVGGRRLDLVALNMWAARSYRIVGIEIKVSRGDWLRELAQFEKSEEWTAIADQFYVVTPSKLVRDDELPSGWGLLEFTGTRLMTKRHAAVQKGQRDTLPRELAARFLTRADAVATQAAQEAQWAASEELRASVKKQSEREIADLRARLQQARAQYQELLDTAGISPHEWDCHKAALRACAVFARCDQDQQVIRRQLESVRTLFGSRVNDVTRALAELPAITCAIDSAATPESTDAR